MGGAQSTQDPAQMNEVMRKVEALARRSGIESTTMSEMVSQFNNVLESQALSLNAISKDRDQWKKMYNDLKADTKTDEGNRVKDQIEWLAKNRELQRTNERLQHENQELLEKVGDLTRKHAESIYDLREQLNEAEAENRKVQKENEVLKLVTTDLLERKKEAPEGKKTSKQPEDKKKLRKQKTSKWTPHKKDDSIQTDDSDKESINGSEDSFRIQVLHQEEKTKKKSQPEEVQCNAEKEKSATLTEAELVKFVKTVRGIHLCKKVEHVVLCGRDDYGNKIVMMPSDVESIVSFKKQYNKPIYRIVKPRTSEESEAGDVLTREELFKFFFAVWSLDVRKEISGILLKGRRLHVHPKNVEQVIEVLKVHGSAFVSSTDCTCGASY